MLYKNTFKLLFSNSNLIWKVVFYLIIAGVCVTGLSLLIALPIVQVLVNERFFEIISEIYDNFLSNMDLKGLILRIGDLSIKFVDIINENMSRIFLSLFGVGFVFLILGSIVINFYSMPTSNCLYYYMSSNAKHPFLNSMASTFKKNIVFQLVNLLFLVPINFGIFYLLIYSFRLFRFGGFLTFVSPFIVLFGYTLIMSFKTTILCGWLPSMVVRNKGVFSGLKDAMLVPKRRFGQTFGNSFALVLTTVFLNVFGGVFTYGVGLIITLPVSILLFNIFGMVSYYSANGQRYYLDSYNVMAPKTMEYTDKLENQKFIV